jgi:hypothetical protein
MVITEHILTFYCHYSLTQSIIKAAYTGTSNYIVWSLKWPCGIEERGGIT